MAKSFKEFLTSRTIKLIQKRLANGKDVEIKAVPFANKVEVYHISDIKSEWQYSAYGYVGLLHTKSLQFKDCNEDEFKLKDLNYIREFSDTNKSNIFYWVDWSDECKITRVFFYDKRRTNLIENEDEYIIRLSNGTVFNLNELHWYNRADSKHVLESIEKATLERIAKRFGTGGMECFVL